MRGVLGAVLALAAAVSAGPVRADGVPRRGQSILEADLVGAANPEGLLLTIRANRRWSRPGGEGVVPAPYLQAGVGAGTSPAYGKASVHAEWMPHPVLQLRAEYTLNRFYGRSGALLSFPSGEAAFGREEIDALAGDEKKAWGRRLLLRPTLRVPLGPVLLRNVTDLAYCRFDGRGPYFLEWEYGTLAKDGSWIFSDSLQALLKLWQGRKAASLYGGPFFEVTHAESAGITQERAGLVAAWTLSEGFGVAQRPRVYVQTGIHVRDPNRRGEPYVVLGAGFDLDLP